MNILKKILYSGRSPTREFIPGNDWSLIKKLFRNSKEKPKNMTEFKPVYIQMIKNICNPQMIGSVRERSGMKIKTRIYDLNMNYIREHIELNKYSNPKVLNFDKHFIELLNIKPVIVNTTEKDENFYDLDKDLNVWDE